MDPASIRSWRRGHELAAAHTAAEARALPIEARIAQLESLRRSAIEHGWVTTTEAEIAQVRARFVLLGARVGARSGR